MVRLTQRRQRLYYGWYIVGAAFSTQILNSSLLFLSQGIYLVQLETTFRWSRGAISWAFALIRFESGLLGPIQGWMVDRWGPRPVMYLGILMFGGGFVLFGAIQELWQLFASLAVVAVGSSLSGFLTIHTAIAHWFLRKRARAMSLTSSGFAIGAIIAPAVAWSIASFGWRPTAVGSGLLIIAVGMPASSVFRRSPEHYGLLPDGEPAPPPLPGGQRRVVYADTDFTVREAVKDRSFWLIALGHGMALLVVGTIPVHLVPHLTERNGWEPAVASLVFPGIMVMQIVGQITGGILGDMYSKRLVAGVAMSGHGAALMLLAFSTSVPVVVIAVILHGLAWGGRGPLMMAIRADYFGRRSIGLISGWSSVITMGGSIIGPVYAGVLHDSLGNYTFAFWTLGLATVVSTILFFAARKPPPPVRTLVATAAGQEAGSRP